MKLLACALLVVGCTSNGGSTNEYVLTGDSCKAFTDQQSCDADSSCEWFDLGIACQVGQPCISGECQSKTTNGSGGGGSGSATGSAACACSDGGVCYEQIGGPAQQGGSGPGIECYPASACPGGCASPCDEIVGQGTCTEDPSVAGLCICDNGVR